MSIPAWPNTLPQRLLVNGFDESPADALLRSNMEAGPAKQRRRSAAGSRTVNGKLVLTSTELADLLTFFNTTLLNGSLRFSWVEPRDGTTANEMRFTAVPSFTAINGYLYDVTLPMEIMP